MQKPPGTLKKRMAAGVVACMLGLGGTVVLAAPASAAPWDCPISGAGLSRSTYCNNGSGQFRVAIFCINRLNGGATGTYRYGPWMPRNNYPSTGWCNWYERVGVAWAQTRG